MSKRLSSLLVIIVLLSFAVLPFGSASAADSAYWTFDSVTAFGCDSGGTTLAVSVADMTTPPYYQQTIVSVGPDVYMNQLGSFMNSDGPGNWSIFATSSGGATTAAFPMPSDTAITVEMILWDSTQTEQLSVGTLQYICNTGQVLSFVLDTTPGADTASVAGCDVLVNIPDSAVGAAITTDTPVYWKPGEVSDEVFPAGLTLRAIGVDESGMYTQVLYVCGFYWVPTSAIGPNYNAPWNGAPLPTGVVK